MKSKNSWMFAAILSFCGLLSLVFTFNSCKSTSVDASSPQELVVKELIRTSQSWDGVELPDYFNGRPELVAVKYVFPADSKLGWHHHPVINYGVLVECELTIIGLDGKTKVVHAGEAVVEMVNTIHHGENRGKKTSSSVYVLSLTGQFASCSSASGYPVVIKGNPLRTELGRSVSQTIINQCG